MPAFKSHHTATSDGPWDGPANLTGCSSGIGILNGGRGGTKIPPADRAGVHADLAGHLQDGKKEVPPLKGLGAEAHPLVFSSLQDQTWAILPGKLEEITALVESFLANERPQIIDAALSKSRSDGEGPAYQMLGQGVALVPIEGTLMKRMNLFNQMSGGTSYDKVGRALQAAVADPNVRAILLSIDSPGGTLDGAKSLADQIFAARQIKPIVAHSDGQMASAAYWLGSAAHKVMASDTALVGSIGVAGTHFDRSGADAQKGVKRTIIATGQYKRIAHDAGPLSPAGQDYLQQMSDTYYQLFLDSVGKHRGLNGETVHAQMGDGRTFIGQQAQDAGLVDQIGSLEEAAALAASLAQAKKLGNPQGGGLRMDRQTLQAQHPEVYAEVMALGVGAERARAVRIIQAGGDDQLIMEAIERGLTAEAALDKLVQAERQARASAEAETQTLKDQAAAELEAQATKPQGQAGADGDTFEGHVAALVAAGKSRSEAIRLTTQDFPALHEAYLAQANTKKK